MCSDKSSCLTTLVLVLRLPEVKGLTLLNIFRNMIQKTWNNNSYVMF